jgi:AcrR family transcriptional regulator
VLFIIRYAPYHKLTMPEHQDPPSPQSTAGRLIPAPLRRGRPRSRRADRAILDAAQDLLIQGGYPDLHLEHVAARAGVGKATIYRRWPSKEALALQLLLDLASPHIAVPETGDTREELLGVVGNAIRALTETPFGPVVRALLSQIAINPSLGDPFRTTVVQARRNEVARVIGRGIARGDLLRSADIDVATELLVGPVYFRLMFGGELSRDFAERVVAVVLHGYGARGEPPSTVPAGRRTGSGPRLRQ